MTHDAAKYAERGSASDRFYSRKFRMREVLFEGKFFLGFTFFCFSYFTALSEGCGTFKESTFKSLRIFPVK